MGLGGSKILDDRRRRRLVLETELDDSGLARSRGEPNGSSNQETVPPDLWMFLPQVVPQKLWKCCVAGAVAAVGLVGTLIAWLFAEDASTSGSVLGDLISPLADRLLRGSGAVAWWLAAQMSCVVWWVRSRSRVDYGGRFHVWGWSAAGFFAAAALSLTDAHRSVAQIVAWAFTGVTVNSMGVTALWLLPLLVAGMTWWATLGAEFRNDLASRVLHSLSAVAALSLMGIELFAVRMGDTTSSDFLCRLALTTLQWCNLMSVWLHLRHVVHVSADPPSLSVSGWLAAWRYGPGQMVAAMSRRTTDAPDNQETQTRMRVESADGTSQEVRIDEPEATPKGPTMRTRQSARK